MKINILVVDDSKSTLYYVESLLEAIDETYKIIMVNSGSKALESVKQQNIDLIILDIQMPDMTGFEVAKLLKSNNKTADIPVVFLTASSHLKTEGLKLGAVDYLTKPIDEDLFTSRILLYSRLIKSIKDNREKDQRIQQQSRLAQMGEMISMIAHQWRQPLGAISSTIIDLQMQSEFENFNLASKEESQEYEKYINNGLGEVSSLVQNLTSTIDDFKDFYKSNKTTRTVKAEDFISKSLNIIKASLINDNIRIIQEFNSKEELNIYENEMMQVILNIIKNSQDNFKDKEIQNPWIKITTQNRSIIICDNGEGIPKYAIKRIFEPYFSTKEDKNGTGLGLYMSKTIVEEHHNGILSVQNTEEGVCFTIEFK